MLGHPFQLLLLGLTFTMVLGMRQPTAEAGENIAIKLWPGVAPGSERFLLENGSSEDLIFWC